MGLFFGQAPNLARSLDIDEDGHDLGAACCLQQMHHVCRRIHGVGCSEKSLKLGYATGG